MKRYFTTNDRIDKGPSYSLEINRAKDSYIYQNDKSYLDLRSGLWNVSLGYNVELYQSVKEKFNEIFDNGLPYLDINSYQNSSYIDYANNILDFMNIDNHFKSISYTSSGSEGVEMCVKISHDYAKNFGKKSNKIIVFKNSYHGTFFGSMSVSHKFFGLDNTYQTVGDVLIVDPPQNQKQLELILEIIEKNNEQISSFFIEPILGSGGSIYIKEEYLNSIILACRNSDILTVFDEVSTGFYRTGERFFFRTLDVMPNVVILSKSINNGITPFGLIAIDEYVYLQLSDRNINHFSTQSGNLLSIASAQVTLDFYKINESKIMENVRKLEEITSKVAEKFNIKFSGKGAMFSFPTLSISDAVQLRDRLKSIGIIVYIYNNIDSTTGISIHPNLLMNTSEYNKALNIICSKLGAMK